MTSIPIVLVTGFLGSGKTTLMRRLVGDAHRRHLRAGVIVNEFGAADIDSHILRAADAELIASIAGGCACCTGQDDLHEALLEIGLRPTEEQPSLLLMEASGLADPVTLLDVVTASDLLRLFHVATIAAVIDAGRFAELLGAIGQLLRRQTELADLVVLNKIDIADSRRIETAQAAVRGLNAGARLEPAVQCAFDLDAFWARALAPVAPRRHGAQFDTSSPDYAHRSAHALICPLPHPVHRARLEQALSDLPPAVWRAKGFVNLRGEAALHLVQYTGGSGGGRFQIGAFHLPPYAQEPETQLVLLGAELDLAIVTRLARAIGSAYDY